MKYNFFTNKKQNLIKSIQLLSKICNLKKEEVSLLEWSSLDKITAWQQKELVFYRYEEIFTIILADCIFSMLMLNALSESSNFFPSTSKPNANYIKKQYTIWCIVVYINCLAIKCLLIFLASKSTPINSCELDSSQQKNQLFF